MAKHIQLRDFFRRRKPLPPLNQRLLAVYMANRPASVRPRRLELLSQLQRRMSR